MESAGEGASDSGLARAGHAISVKRDGVGRLPSLTLLYEGSSSW